MTTSKWWCLACVALARPAWAQGPQSLAQAAAAITAADLTRHIKALAADSMREGDASGHSAERVARYVISQFQQLGLQPAAKDSGWLQRYPVPGQQVVSSARSQMYFFIPTFRRSGKDIVTERAWPLTMMSFLRFADGARVGAEPKPRAVTKLTSEAWERALGDSMHTVLVAGRHTAASIKQAVPAHKIVVYVPPGGGDAARQRAVLEALLSLSDGVVILAKPDSSRPAAVTPLVDEYLQGTPAAGPRATWMVEVDPSAVRGFLGAMEIDLPRLRADTTPVARVLPFAQVQAAFEADSVIAPVTAANVVGILPGADSTVRHQYLIIAAPMDTPANPSGGGRDSMHADVDDDLSGVAGLLSLAKAFSQPGARPRRSIMFIAVGGDRQGRWGSSFFTQGPSSEWMGLRNRVAALTLDRIGRGSGPLAVDGSEDVDLGQPVPWTAANHPELGVTIVDGGTSARPESDALPFMRQGAPSFAFHREASADSAPSRGGSTFDAEQAARIARLIFYVGEQIASADRRPQWTPAGRSRYLESAAR